MSDVPFYAPNQPPTPPRTPTPGRHQWSLWKDGARTDCELRIHGEHGVEVQLLRDGTLYMGTRCITYASAESLAEHERFLLEREGWRDLTTESSEVT